ncbi:MAG: hypothetical protein LAT63_08135 [Marinobacter sp.]|nr:hypothetical protein [Marinobacter sp.]
MLPLRSLLAYLALTAAVLLFVPGAGSLGALCVVTAIMLGWQDLRGVPRGILAVAGLLFVIALAVNPVALLQAADNMTRLAGVILAVMLLASVLGRFSDLQAVSTSLFQGRAGVRYGGIAFGTGLISVPLNFGAVALMGSLIRHRIDQHGDSPATRNATRAALRGFGVSPLVSPLSISIALTLTLLPALSGMALLGVGIPLGVFILVLGLGWREPEIQPALQAPRQRVGAGPWLRFSTLILLICLAVFLLSHALNVSYARAVATSCLATVVLALLWARLRGRPGTLPDMSTVSNELAIVGGSAFIGSLVSALILAGLPTTMTLPLWLWPLLALLLPAVFFAAGMVGVNPIVCGTLAGGILGSLWPEPALLGLGVAIIGGWSTTAMGTPYAANALLMERFTGYRARHASLRWNLGLSRTCLIVTGVLAAGLTWNGL